MSRILQVPVQVVGMTPKKDRSWKLTFETGRELVGEDVSLLVEYLQGEGWLQFSPNEELPPPPDEPADAGVKSPSERLRAVLYVLWEQRGKPGTWNGYYTEKMEEMIEAIKERLERMDARES